MLTTPAAAPGRERLGAQAWALLLVLSGAIFLEGADMSMMGVALPAIREELGMSTTSLQWVVSAYVLGYGGFVLLGGRIGDLVGRRRLFLLALTAFVLFSGLGGLAQDGGLLIASRFATGLAAAFMTPVGLSIITTTIPEGRRRNQALLVYAGFAAGGFSLGLVLGGLLTGIDWRWVFFAPVILAAALLAVAPRVIPRDAPAARDGGFDLRGAALLTAGMLLAVYAVVESPAVAFGQTLAVAAAAAATLAAFVAAERRARSPLVRLGLLRQGTVTRANLGAILWAGSFVGFQFVTVLYLQQLRGWSPVVTGLALLPVAVDAVLAPTVTPRLVERFGLTRTISAGMALGVIGYGLFLPIGHDSLYAAAMLPTMVLIGLAFTLVYGPLTIAATDGVAEQEQGLASGLFNTAFQLGAALGLAIAAAVVVAATGAGGSPDDLLDGYRAGLVVPVAGALLALAVTLSGARRGAPAPG
ncbi:MAG TPA: MFS transporter [Solirubrobacteraceae bacterium]|nr:MFS transporter [Solirubrobacteraceae bacterium]